MHLKFELGGCSGPARPLVVAMLVAKVSAFGRFISLDGFPSEYFTERTYDRGLHTVRASLHINSLNSLKPR